MCGQETSTGSVPADCVSLPATGKTSSTQPSDVIGEDNNIPSLRLMTIAFARRRRVAGMDTILHGTRTNLPYTFPLHLTYILAAENESSVQGQSGHATALDNRYGSNVRALALYLPVCGCSSSITVDTEAYAELTPSPRTHTTPEIPANGM